MEGTGASGGGRTAGFTVVVVVVFAVTVVVVLEGLGGAADFVVFGAGFDFEGGFGRLGGGGGSSSVFYKVRL